MMSIMIIQTNTPVICMLIYLISEKKIAFTVLLVINDF